MRDVKAAFRSVFPLWLALCAISIIWGLTMQALPGLMEAQSFYPTSWPANLAHYDPHDYLLVAEQGYGSAGRDYQTSVRFPLFPFLTRVFAQITSVDPYLALFAVSKAALLVGLIGLWLLVAHLHGAAQAERAALYLLFPLLGSGYAWMMSYPESLHLALWTFGFYLLYKRQYALCGLVTVLNVWSRPQGIVIVPVFAGVLIAEALREHRLRGLLDGKLWQRGLVTCTPPLLAFVAWILHVSRVTQLPLSPLAAQQIYGRVSLVAPWTRFPLVLGRPFRSVTFTWGLTLETYQYVLVAVSLVILVAVALRRRLPWSLVLFSMLSISVGLTSSENSIGRYALLTWIPSALIYVVPPRYDRAVVPVGVALSFLTLVVLGLIGEITP